MKVIGRFLAAIFFSLCLSSCNPVIEEPPASSNTLAYLDIQNYLGNVQNIHPKVLYFEDGWRGYPFWMAYTPYPNGSTDAENPCIAVSLDGIEWTTPQDLVNPLAFAPEGGYNSDTHLVYNEKEDALECWWREYNIAANCDAICRRMSADGVNWSEKETILPYNPDWHARLSPAVWIEDGKYKMVYSVSSKLYYIQSPLESFDDEWSEPQVLPIDWGELYPWHQDLIVDEDGCWELVVCCWAPGGSNNAADLYYVKIDPEKKSASSPEMIIARGENKEDFDHRSIYRSSIVKVNDLYYIYYSAIDEGWNRYMSLMRGESVFDLYGL